MRGHVAEVFGIDEAKITVVPNGVDPEDLQPVANLPSLRARYAQPDEQLVLLVGRLVYEKGFHLALDALPGVIERVGNVRFLVAGSGTAERDLKAQAQKLGLLPHGEFVGWIDDAMLHSLYAMSDLCVIPSLYEPFGLVALEAMASGCPCIVADTGGLREVVPGGGRVGLRFTPRDSASLAERMESVLTDAVLRDRLVAEASEHILSFDWADVARRTVEVYADLLAREPAGGMIGVAGATGGLGSRVAAAAGRARRRAAADRARPGAGALAPGRRGRAGGRLRRQRGDAARLRRRRRPVPALGRRAPRPRECAAPPGGGGRGRRGRRAPRLHLVPGRGARLHASRSAATTSTPRT